MDIRDKLAREFEEERIALKVVEECMELCEVLVKRVTKVEDSKPPLYKVIEEMGDLTFRLQCLARKLRIDEAVEARVIEKAKQIDDWLETKLKHQ